MTGLAEDGFISAAIQGISLIAWGIRPVNLCNLVCISGSLTSSPSQLLSDFAGNPVGEPTNISLMRYREEASR